MSTSLSSALLISYIVSETTRANYAYYVFHVYPNVSPSLVALLSELLKLAVALVVMLIPSAKESIFVRALQFWNWMLRRGGGYALPAALYLINNLIYMTVLPLTSPSLLQVCVLAKLPATGILHHYMIKRQHNVFAWTSLFFLCIGLVIFNVPTKIIHTSTSSGWYLAPITGAVIAALSAIASISSENLVKTGDFWMAQTGLYLWGVIFSIVSIPIMGLFDDSQSSNSRGALSTTFDSLIPAGILICITAGTGLVVASLLRFRDNILKVIGTSATLVTVAASQYVLNPELRATNFTPLKVCGGSIVGICTWCYNHWNQAPWPPVRPARYATIKSDELREILDGHKLPAYEELKSQDMPPQATKSTLFEPDATKLLCCALIIGFTTAEMAWSS